MKQTLAKKFQDEALTLTTVKEFEKLRKRERRNLGIGHKFWGMYHFDDESMVEYRVFLDGIKIWVYNEARAMKSARPKIIKPSGMDDPKYSSPVPGSYRDD